MKKRIFFISKHPDIDHICSYLFFSKLDGYQNFIIATDNDAQLNHYLIKEIIRTKYAKKIIRLDFKNYKFCVWIYCLLKKRFFLYLTKYFLRKDNFEEFNEFLNMKLINNLSARVDKISRNAEIYLDHWNSNRIQDQFVNKFIRNSLKTFSLPHALHYAENNIKYKKALQSFKTCFANKIYFYNDSHIKQVKSYVPSGTKIAKLYPYRYSSKWFKFRIESFKKNYLFLKKRYLINKLSVEDTVIFLDTPFFGNEYLENKRKELFNLLNKKYNLIIVAHPRRKRLSTNFKAILWDGEIAFLISKFYKFVGIFTTLSIDLAQTKKLYITCNFLRDQKYRDHYKLIDEDIGATKLARNTKDVFNLLETKHDESKQKSFLDKIGINFLNIN